ncbi:MAG TPA: aspartate aminotransferase family protein [Thermodesulfobacteriota bacterium]|nr:aspartate aminotransferase family protein [Thermodesulfobacteriota bacterium]
MDKKTGNNEVIKKAERFLTPALVFHTAVVAARAEGIYVEGTDGRRYMDLSAGLATVNVGHCHPEVVRAAKEQTERLIHSGGIFYHRPGAELAEALERITPAGIEMFFFSNSGAEAVEGAVKLARYHTRRQGVIAFTGGFHGRTSGALALTTSSSRYRKHYHPLLPSVYHSPYPYCYRCPMGRSRQECSMECFDYLSLVFKHQIDPEEVACVIIEPVLGEGGYVVPPAEFMKRLRELCTEKGVLFIADEVQCGMGRTGRWFACEHFGVRPDVMTIAKGIASGFPLSAVGSSRDIMGGWAPGAHGTTFGGNPVSCAASKATINVIEGEKLLENARNVGSYAMDRLAAMRKKHPFIGDVRGLGLMIGVEFVRDDCSPDRERLDKVIKKCLALGVIIVECGVDKNIARLMPPLTIKESEMSSALDVFEEALG